MSFPFFSPLCLTVRGFGFSAHPLAPTLTRASCMPISSFPISVSYLLTSVILTPLSYSHPDPRVQRSGSSMNLLTIREKLKIGICGFIPIYFKNHPDS
jgi:hypothetical protein